MVVQLGAHRAPAAPSPKSTEVQPPAGAPKPGFRNVAPRNMAANQVKPSTPVTDLKAVKKEVDGAIAILTAEFKRNAANAGRIDTVALSNACNQLQATSKKIDSILLAVDRPL